MPVLAGIDVGSNAVRMLIAESDGEFRRLSYLRRTTRLGSFSGGEITEKSLRLTIETLLDYKKEFSPFKPQDIKAVGTSALREARNSSPVLKKIEEKTGIRIEVLQPEEEARLTALGVISFLKPASPFSLIVDMGGGSTEWTLMKNKEILKCGSIPVGVVKLWDKIKDLPGWEKTLDRELSLFSEKVRREISPEKEFQLIQTGGTASTLASIDLGLSSYDHGKIQGHMISLSKLETLFTKLKGLSIPERMKIPGLPADRADLIMPGTGLTITIMKAFSIDRVTISDTGLPEGIIISLLESR